MKPNAKNGNQSKKTETIMLVPVLPPSSQPENFEGPNPNIRKRINAISETNVAVNKPIHRRSKSRPENAASAPRAEGNAVDPDDVPLKKTRGFRRQSSSNSGGPFWDRNAGKSDESDSKEPEAFQTRSPLRQKRTLDEKENNNRR